MYDNKRIIPGGLAHGIYEEKKRSVLAIIEENVPASMEQDKPADYYNDNNPRSAEANL